MATATRGIAVGPYEGKPLGYNGMIKLCAKPGVLIVAFQAICWKSSPFVDPVVGSFVAAKAIVLVSRCE